MAIDFSGFGKWYKYEVGADDGFENQTFTAREYAAREYAGERTLFDINGKKERSSDSIGANWYYAEETMTVEDRKSYLLHLVSLRTLTTTSCRRSR